MLKQHQREESPRLRLVGCLGRDEPGEPDGLLGEVVAVCAAVTRCVPFGEHEVDDGEYPAQPFGACPGRWHSVRDSGCRDLAFRPQDPLRHGVLAHQEGAGDLARGQAADRPQGQGDPGLEGEGRVAAGEHQP